MIGSDLPDIPQVFKDREYKPSGKFPAYALPVMFIGDIVIGAAIGAMAPYIFFGVAFMSAAITTPFLAICWAIMLGLLYLIAIGIVIGFPMWMLAKMVRCRNIVVALVAGGLAGSCSTVVYYFSFMNLNIPEEFKIAGLEWIIVILAGLVLIIASMIIPFAYIKTTAYCEKCNRWYGKQIEGTIPVEAANMVIEAFSTNSIDSLKNIGNIDTEEEEEFLKVKIRKCTECIDSDYQVNIDMYSREFPDNPKAAKKISKKKTWIETMLPSSIGKQLYDIIYGQVETKRQKKQKK